MKIAVVFDSLGQRMIWTQFLLRVEPELNLVSIWSDCFGFDFNELYLTNVWRKNFS